MNSKRRDSKGRLLRDGESQRKDGRYMYRYTDNSGTRRTVYSWKLVETDSVPAGKKQELSLRQMEITIRRDVEDHIGTAQSETITVDDMFERFMGTRLDLRETTRANYRGLYSIHIKPMIGNKPISKVRASEIQKMYIEMSKVGGLKISTITATHVIAWQVFEMAVMDNLIRTNPCTNGLKPVKRLSPAASEKRHALTIQEQERLVDYIYSTPRYQRYGPLVTILLGTGMRIGEAIGLRWCDCDFDERIIHVTHTVRYTKREHGGFSYMAEEPKTKASIRDIPMLSGVVEAFRREQEMQKSVRDRSFAIGPYTDFIFLNRAGKVFKPNFIYEQIQSAVFDYNHEEFLRANEERRKPVFLPKISAHILRHTFCTRVCESGMNIKVVQDIMGHRNITTTMDVYNEATKDAKRSGMAELDGELKII